MLNSLHELVIVRPFSWGRASLARLALASVCFGKRTWAVTSRHDMVEVNSCEKCHPSCRDLRRRKYWKHLSFLLFPLTTGGFQYQVLVAHEKRFVHCMSLTSLELPSCSSLQSRSRECYDNCLQLFSRAFSCM